MSGIKDGNRICLRVRVGVGDEEGIGLDTQAHKGYQEIQWNTEGIHMDRRGTNSML